MKVELHEYQKYCLGRLLEQKEVGLFLDMGLGKTLITLMAILKLVVYRLEVRKVLVIAPKKVAEATWDDEIEKWEDLRFLRISKVMGTREQRLRALYQDADIYIIARDNIAWLTDYYKYKWEFDMVVIDELSSFKNSDSKRFKHLRYVRPYIKRIVGLTGTPAPNGYLDLWAQITMLDRGARFGTTLTGYRAKYFNSVTTDYGDRYTLRKGAEKEILAKISDLCISLRAKDYIAMPKLVNNTVPIVLSKKARKLYDTFEEELLLPLEDETIRAVSAAVLTNKLLQCCNGRVYDQDREDHLLHDDKVEAFGELVEQLHGQHAIVFYSYQHDIPPLEDYLSSTDLRYRRLQDKEDMQAWNRGEVDILLAHPASCAYGLNLQHGGRHIIWFGLTWSLELYQQAVARLYRQGQQDTVIVHHLVVKDSMDEEVMRRISRKGKTQDNLLESLKARIDKVRSRA